MTKGGAQRTGQESERRIQVTYTVRNSLEPRAFYA